LPEKKSLRIALQFDPSALDFAPWALEHDERADPESSRAVLRAARFVTIL
jgi:hypothetical protein